MKKLQKQLSALLLVSATAGIMVSTSVSAEEMIPSDQKISSAQPESYMSIHRKNLVRRYSPWNFLMRTLPVRT